MNEPTTSDLSGVSGLGPVRRRLLSEAGITTRAELARATAEQIVSITGMPLSLAEQVARSVATAADPPNRGTAPDHAPETDTPPPPGGEESLAPGEDAPRTTRLERAALRARAAIADASRHAGEGSKLSETLSRFARLADELPGRVTPETRGGVVKRLTERVEGITERLEGIGTTKKAGSLLGTKRAKRLEQRLKRTRDSIKRTLKTSASNSPRKEVDMNDTGAP